MQKSSRQSKSQKLRIPVVDQSSKGFAFTGGGTIPSPTTWGQWLKNQPAPVAKPNHKLDRLTIYFATTDQEYDISLDLFDRWGYALNVGYGANHEAIIADAKSTTPVLIAGRLLKLAINDPNKYPVAMGVSQIWYVDEPFTQNTRILKEAYLRNAAGDVIGGWSPEATPYAMGISVDYKCSPLAAMQALGINITNIYDGGERGLHVAGETPDADFGRDPRVVAARGSEDWVNYISRKKGEHTRLTYQRIKEISPNRSTYVYYPISGTPYSAIPGARVYGYNYDQMRNSQDVPNGSVYWRDVAVTAAGMGNPGITDRLYLDQFSHFLEAVAEQIVVYGQTLTYNFVSAGLISGDSPNKPANYYFLPIPSYKGFLKCMYATGQKGAIAGYFSEDCRPGHPTYPAYDVNKPPHWLLQEMALGEVHARFSWLDDYIFDGDLLPGVGAGRIKKQLPPFEFAATRKAGDFYAPIPEVRVIVRKRKLQDSWLVVLWSPEVGSPTTAVTTGLDQLVYVNTIPGLPPIQFVAGGEGSIYTVVKTSAGITTTRLD